MTSQINPNDIDGNYPIAGVSNNTQGMRDNFTNTKTNFQYASDEITDLQSKVLLKAALTGTTLDNNLANNVMYNAQIRGFSGTTVAIANTSGTINIDCNAGHYQSIYMAGNISLGFDSNTWPTAGTAGMIRTQITVDQAGRTMALPVAVSNGVTGIQGFSSNVITFAQAGTYEFGFLTTTGGSNITMFDLNRPLSYYTNDVTMLGNLTVGGDIFGNVTITDISVGNVTASGNVQSGNLRTTGLVSATGNVQAGNLRTTGLISSTGNITGGNILGGANVNATTHTGTTVSVTGNITGGNLIISGSISDSAQLDISTTSANANIVLTPNGTGNVNTGANVSVTGNIQGGNVLSGAVVSAVGAATILSSTAVPAGGTTGSGYKFSSTANLGVFFGSGVPTLTAAKGSLYLRTDGSTTNDRMYVNTNGSTTWTAVTTAA
jgi:hypothetical protein